MESTSGLKWIRVLVDLSFMLNLGLQAECQVMFAVCFSFGVSAFFTINIIIRGLELEVLI